MPMAIVGISLQAVYNWVTLDLASHQVSAFEDAPRSGRPRTAIPITSARILGEVGRNPLRLGYPELPSGPCPCSLDI
jgi:hypothetical protein